MSMFEKAARLKLRFDTVKGQLTAEDLFDLPLTSHTGKVNLDDLARGYFKQMTEANDISFVEPTWEGDKTVQLQFEIVKHVIDAKIADNKAEAAKREAKEKKQMLMGILAQKQNEALSQKSVEELQEMIQAL